MDNKVDPNHDLKRGRMTGIAIILLIIGVPCGVLGVIFFVSVFFTHNFLFAPIGLVMAAIGGFTSMFGLQLLTFSHAGKIARYQAGEMVPVAKDVTRDFTPVAGDVVRQLAAAAREGFTSQPPSRTVHSCGAENEAGDNFCKGCGQPIGQRVCRKCGEPGDRDANFCGKCGNPLA